MKNVDKKIIPLTDLPTDKKARIFRLDSRYGFQKKLRVMGIREGQVITVISKQLLRGPLTVNIGGSQITLGRGMAQKIIVEVI